MAADGAVSGEAFQSLAEALVAHVERGAEVVASERLGGLREDAHQVGAEGMGGRRATLGLDRRGPGELEVGIVAALAMDE